MCNVYSAYHTAFLQVTWYSKDFWMTTNSRVSISKSLKWWCNHSSYSNGKFECRTTSCQASCRVLYISSYLYHTLTSTWERPDVTKILRFSTYHGLASSLGLLWFGLHILAELWLVSEVARKVDYVLGEKWTDRLTSAAWCGVEAGAVWGCRHFHSMEKTWSFFLRVYLQSWIPVCLSGYHGNTVMWRSFTSRDPACNCAGPQDQPHSTHRMAVRQRERLVGSDRKRGRGRNQRERRKAMFYRYWRNSKPKELSGSQL